MFALALARQIRLTGKTEGYRWQRVWPSGMCGMGCLAPLDSQHRAERAILIIIAVKKSGQMPATEVAGQG